MLPKLYRLTGQRNFRQIAERGRAVFLKELGIKWLENNLTNSRFGFVISTQIDKRAVVRNKIKRRLREIIYQNLKKIKSGFDILVITRLEIKGLNFWQMKEKLELILKRAGLLI